MKIIWSPLALEQARDIAAYIALDKPSAAEKWIEETFNSVERLIAFPESGRIVTEIKRNNIREVVQGSYRLIYKIEANQILVLLVKNCRQKLTENEVL